mmetsp:Transcript_7293/g.26625  ORF Transcript_7293/g.26625 Transcript_7293/m.26625 type:complete len:200 (-) Transcript_7293:875-1474(-)
MRTRWDAMTVDRRDINELVSLANISDESCKIMDSQCTWRKSTTSNMAVLCVVSNTLNRGSRKPLKGSSVPFSTVPEKDHSCRCTAMRHSDEPRYSTRLTSGATRPNSLDHLSKFASSTMINEGALTLYPRLRAAIKLAAISACREFPELSTTHTPSFSSHVAMSQREIEPTMQLRRVEASFSSGSLSASYGRSSSSLSN